MVNAAQNQAIVVGGFSNVEGKVFDAPTHTDANEKERVAADDSVLASKETGDINIKPATPADSDGYAEKDPDDSDDVIIITGADAARHLLPLRDDGDPALTVRSLALATILSGFQAVMYQIYMVSNDSRAVFCKMNHQGDPLTFCVFFFSTVQTDDSHHFGNLHCAHRLLSRQGMGCRLAER